MNCRATLAQTNPVLGDVRSNLAAHLAIAEEAARAGSNLVLFPELSLTGYFLKDMALELALPREAPELRELAACSREISIAAGFVERSRDGRVYNAYALFERGELVGLHRKVHLVSYGMFEESRDLAAGDRFATFESVHGRFGVLVCEDFWHMGGLYTHFVNDCDAILVPSCSPARGAEAEDSNSAGGFSSVRTWETLLDAAALFTQSWIVYVNRVGFEDGIAFAGGSRVVDPFGRAVARLAGLDPGCVEVELTSAALHRARGITPLRRDEKPWVLAAELERLRARPEERR
jgi:predicted amidohydrolase